MVVVSLSGLGLIYFVKRRFVSGVLLAVTGALLSILGYFWLVP